jgi:hypothetical protein
MSTSPVKTFHPSPSLLPRPSLSATHPYSTPARHFPPIYIRFLFYASTTFQDLLIDFLFHPCTPFLGLPTHPAVYQRRTQFFHTAIGTSKMRRIWVQPCKTTHTDHHRQAKTDACPSARSLADIQGRFSVQLYPSSQIPSPSAQLLCPI